MLADTDAGTRVQAKLPVENRTKSERQLVCHQYRGQAVAERHQQEQEIYQMDEQRLSPESAEDGITRIEEEDLVVHLYPPHRQEVEVEDSVHQAEVQAVISSIRTSGRISSTTSRKTTSYQSSTSCSARNVARSIRSPSRWIYAMQKRRARCTSPGKER